MRGDSSALAFLQSLGSDQSNGLQEDVIHFRLCLTLPLVSGERPQPGHKPRTCHFIFYLKWKSF